ncbi:PEP-CTERM sorting domain-containing protein [Aeoliella sp. ICT_H6.2]|uniref:PEP-CTERM sorting domain-containing protein n=1 Tax=Aeoliella straminimaris TaxID=2954799 RepID=A0A9X2F695_9BACT|nr:PEP-CTERM sorting domain-containing protein [Aeoliella straminimaris]MCO6043005.1 PEP-CTERM sorting domain-containing protein [Aeoliella straminimaris]
MVTGFVDGKPFSVPPGLFVADEHSPVSVLDQWEANYPENGHFSISAEFDPDPVINYSIAVTDFGAPSTFTFVFSQPIVLAGTNHLVDAQIGGALNDGSGDGITLTPNSPDSDGDTIAEIQTSEVGLGAPSVNMGVDVGGAFSNPGTGSPMVFSYPTDMQPVQPGPVGTFDQMSLTVSFTLSGGGDFAALTGFSQIVEVPEPSTVAMLVSGGLLGLVGVYRRRAS